LLAVAGLTPVSAAIQATTTTPTATKVATATAVPPTATKAATAVPPTATKVVTATAVPPTATKVATAVPPTATKVVTATATKVPATATRVPTQTPTRPAARAPRAGTISSLSTAFVLQNMDSTTNASINATFYNVTGTAVATVVASATPYKGVMIDQRSQGGLASGFAGSVVVSSTTQLAAIVNEYSGNSATLLADFRVDSYNGVPSTSGAQAVLLPQVLKNLNSVLQGKVYNSMIAIQNTSATSSATVVITYTNQLQGNATSTHSGIVIPPGASVFIDMANEVGLWTSFFGPARITSDQNIAVIVNQNGWGALLIYRGFTAADAGTTLIVTQAVTNIFSALQGKNYGSGIKGMTLDGGSSTYSVSYTNRINGATKNCSLPAGPFFDLDLRPAFWVPGCEPPVDANNKFTGSVVIVGSVPIVALANTTTDATATGIRTGTFRAFASTGGGTNGYAPMVLNGYYDAGTNATWGSAIEGRLLSGSGRVNIQYNCTDGTTYSDYFDAGADLIFSFDQRLANGQTGFTLPTGKFCSAWLSSTRTMIFSVNWVAASATEGDAYGVYIGIIQ
jgi:hypothetical protein